MRLHGALCVVRMLCVEYAAFTYRGVSFDGYTGRCRVDTSKAPAIASSVRRPQHDQSSTIHHSQSYYQPEPKFSFGAWTPLSVALCLVEPNRTLTTGRRLPESCRLTVRCATSHCSQSDAISYDCSCATPPYDERHGRAYKCTAITDGCSCPSQASVSFASL